METDRQENLNKEENVQNQFIEYPYRWVIVALMGVMVIINGLVNNTVIPIASKLAEVYHISDAYVSSPIIASFLIYSLMNFPANHIIDTKGLRYSFLIGAGLYTVGIFLYALVNRGYHFALLGALFVATGQPFIINCPAKVATYWFFDKNRPFATALMTGFLLIGTATGFILPTLAVSQNSKGQQAQDQIFYLYAGQFLASTIAFILVYIFMRKQPPTPPSIGAEQEKTDLKQSLQIVKDDKNLWVFFSGYMLLYGTLLSFGSTVNLLLKPYGYQDTQIALFALVLIVSGVTGSIVWSLYLKKTLNYRLTIRAIPTISMVFMIMICIALNSSAKTAIIFLFGGIVGFSITPIMPISYDLGCELCFPVGQAQVTGILNGSAMILTFLITLFITSAVSFGSRRQSLIAMIIYICIMGVGTILYYFVKIDLKRRKAEQSGHTININELTADPQKTEEKPQAYDQQELSNDHNDHKIDEPLVPVAIEMQKYVDLMEDREEDREVEI